MIIDIEKSHINCLTFEQQEALKTLQEWIIENSINLNDLSSYYCHPAVLLLSYLRANEFDFDSTIPHILENIKKRKYGNYSLYSETEPSIILNCTNYIEFCQIFPHWHCSFDKLGQPVLYKQFTHLDLKKVLTTINVSNMDKRFKLLDDFQIKTLANYHIWEHEICAKLCMLQSKKLMQVVEKSVLVFDLQNMQYPQIINDFMTYISEVFTLSESLYPKSIHAVYMINIPPGFSALWYMYSTPRFPREFLNTVQLYGGYNEWISVLDGCIGLENVPENYGGTLIKLTSDVIPYAEYLYTGMDDDVVWS